MAGVNFAVLVGHVGADPEIKSAQGGGKVARFSLATSEAWNDKATGEKRERTEWHTVICFSEGLVGVVERFVRKGSQLYVRGQIRTRKYQDKQGADRWTTEIHLSGFDATIQLLGAAGSGKPPVPEDDGYTGRAAQGGGAGSSGAAPSGRGFDDDLNDDVPF